MKIDDSGKQFIKKWEGGQSSDGLFYVYSDATNKPTIGYGHLIKHGESFSTLTKAEADELFDRDVIQFEDAINQLATDTGVTFNQNQFNALVAFSFNVGVGFLDGSSVAEFIQTKNMSVLANMIRQYVGGTTNDVNKIVIVNLSQDNLTEINKAINVSNSLDLEVFDVDSLPSEIIDKNVKIINDKNASIIEQKTSTNTNAIDVLKDALGHNENKVVA